MRVALDARLVAYQRAGIGNYILGLLRGLREIGREDRVVLLTSRRQPADDAEMAGFRVRRILTPPHHRWEQIGLAIEAAVLPVDLFHAADFIPPLVRRFPAVATVHDLAFLRMPGLLTADSRRYYGQVGRAVNDAERAIAVSDCTRRDLIELVGVAPEQIDVVHEAPTVDPAGASDEAFLAVSRAFALPSRYFLFVGTREPRKNLPRLLQAYSRLAQVRDAPGLVIVGRRGWLADDLEAQATSLGVADRVRWLGGVDASVLPALYHGAVALVLPSLYEGFGLPVLDAMVCGCPVACANAGSLPEIAGGAALLFDPFDPEEITAAMLRVWREPSLQDELRGRGRERAAHFSWRRCAEETLGVYQRALGS